MALAGFLERPIAQRAAAGVLSAGIHCGLILLIAFSGGRHDGVSIADTPLTQLILLEAENADRVEGVDLPPVEPAAPVIEEPLQVENRPPASPSVDVGSPEVAAHEITAPAEIAAPTQVVANVAAPLPTPAPPTFLMPQSEQAKLSDQLERLAEQVAQDAPSLVSWDQDGKRYSARFVMQRASDGAEFDRVTAEVSASDGGRELTTRIPLKRLAFSAFTQMVDRWDPMVQLHDDEIVGRFHSNSQFSLMYDSRTAPKFLGKVTTAARSFQTESRGRRRDSDIFQGGVETRASRIDLPDELQPFQWAPREDDALIHELSTDTHIRFYADGSYTWWAHGSEEMQYRSEPTEHPVYFLASRGVALYLQGVLCGKVLVYSPDRIVLEGDLRYAHDPREARDSDDYLGLVSERYIEVAPPHVTGPGDLEIHAAIFAKRRFVVRDIEHRRSATLHILGSVAAGSLSASEPRYATRIEYDQRFEQRRPPGFPSTDRYEVDGWDGRWTEASELSASDAP